MEILYRDAALAVAVKPAGMPSQPDETGREDALRAVSRALGGKAWLVHRLDSGVGGVMVFARTETAAARLSAMAAGNGLQKEYLAVLSGVPEPDEGRLCDYLYRDPRLHKAFVVKKPRRGVKEAALTYRTLEKAPLDEASAALVAVRLETGRFHQIRAQFAARGLPLRGDGKYGGGDNRCGIALWAWRLEFENPFGGGRIVCEKRPPVSFPWTEFQNLNSGAALRNC